jgi:hypothetical protein
MGGSRSERNESRGINREEIRGGKRMEGTEKKRTQLSPFSFQGKSQEPGSEWILGQENSTLLWPKRFETGIGTAY